MKRGIKPKILYWYEMKKNITNKIRFDAAGSVDFEG